MAEATKKILVVDDDLDVAEMLTAYFRVQGYEVAAVQRGEDALQVCQSSRPDIIIMDIRLPDVDGDEVARRLRGNRRTSDIPIIFLTGKRDRSELLHGLELGADDYVTKPFDVQELRLRIRNTLQRAGQDNPNNPVTGLPDTRLVDEHISACLHRLGWGMLAISLANMDVFRESYGFVASDDVLRAAGLMVQNTMKESGGQDDFLGHLGPADLLLITGEERLTELAGKIRNRLEKSLEYFYPLKDREKSAKQGEGLLVRTGMLVAGEANLASVDDVKRFLEQKMNQEWNCD